MSTMRPNVDPAVCQYRYDVSALFSVTDEDLANFTGVLRKREVAELPAELSVSSEVRSHRDWKSPYRTVVDAVTGAPLRQTLTQEARLSFVALDGSGVILESFSKYHELMSLGTVFLTIHTIVQNVAIRLSSVPASFNVASSSILMKTLSETLLTPGRIKSGAGSIDFYKRGNAELSEKAFGSTPYLGRVVIGTATSKPVSKRRRVST